MRTEFKPGTMIYPVPAVLISCGSLDGTHNIFTASWTGTICTNPPMCYVAIRKERKSYGIVKEKGEFVINLTNEKLAKATDWCGVKSGRDFDKIKEMGLTPVKTHKTDCFYLDESPLAIECKVEKILELGSHDMFIAKVVSVLADNKYINPTTGEFRLGDAHLIAYNHGSYYKLGDAIGKFGWSVSKKKGGKKKSKTKNPPASHRRPDGNLTA